MATADELIVSLRSLAVSQDLDEHERTLLDAANMINALRQGIRGQCMIGGPVFAAGLAATSAGAIVMADIERASPGLLKSERA